MKITVPNRVQFFAMFLMALFSLVIVPKELWHNCDHHSHSHHHEDDLSTHGTMEDGADCAICDFQILPFTQTVSTFDFKRFEGFQTESFQLINAPAKGARFTLSGRGPPNFQV